MQQIHVIAQNDMSIDKYYSAFDRLMSALISMVPNCPTASCPAYTFIERFFTYRFVMGVRSEYDSLCARLLHSSDTLTTAKALSDLLAEETRLNSISTSDLSSRSVLAAPQKTYAAKNYSPVPCEHFKKTVYRPENCFVKFPEKLADFRARRGARGRGTVSATQGLAADTPRCSVVIAATSSASSSSWVLDFGLPFT
jgi:hypothetical protein